jgi:integrase
MVKRGKKQVNPQGSRGENFLKQDEVKKFIDSIRDMRDKLCVSILYETGCLLSELVNLKVFDINEQGLRIINPDTKEARVIKITSSLSKKILLYIQGNNISKDSYLLSTKKSSQISVKRVRQIIQFYSQKSGLGVINPQMFRYYHIAHAYLNTVLIENIASRLGITRYRVFQILEELKVSSGENRYENFLTKLEGEK